MIRYLILVLLVVAFEIGGSLAENRSFKSARASLSVELSKNVHLQSVENDLAWLESLIECGPSCIGNDLSIAEVLRMIKTLGLLRNDHECRTESSATLNLILQKLVDAKTYSKRSPTRRLDYLVLALFKEHAHSCSSKHFEMFESLKESTNEQRVSQVMTLCASIARNMRSFKQIKKRLPRSIDINMLNGLKTLVKDSIIGSLYSTLQIMARDDPDLAAIQRPQDLEEDAEFVPDKTKLALLFNKYFVDPCNYYISKLGKKLVIARIDSNFFDEKRLGPVKSQTAMDLRYYLSAVHVCELIRDRGQKEKLLSSMVSFITYYSE